MNKKIQDVLNHQINRELYSAYLYFSMAAAAEGMGLKGFGNWFVVQTQEEMSHAKKMYDYVNSLGGRVALEAIEAPPKDFSSATELFAQTLEHEKKVTGMIKDLVKLAKEENDGGAEKFLEWFIEEQEEEEENAGKNLKKAKGAEGDKGKLSAFDSELAKRIFK